MAVAISLGASFVGRAFAGDKEGTALVLTAAIRHRGYALVEILQPCVTFNKVNTWQWFQERVEPVPDSHDPTDRMKALELAFVEDKLPIGILYINPDRPTFEDGLAAHSGSGEPLYKRKVDRKKLTALIETMR
jgi:2-oxoglutarate ferredoxin oxidoreductase subunit beta